MTPVDCGSFGTNAPGPRPPTTGMSSMPKGNGSQRCPSRFPFSDRSSGGPPTAIHSWKPARTTSSSLDKDELGVERIRKYRLRKGGAG